jgi:hypothetical protein
VAPLVKVFETGTAVSCEKGEWSGFLKMGVTVTVVLGAADRVYEKM